jgi:hypothetical protein
MSYACRSDLSTLGAYLRHHYLRVNSSASLDGGRCSICRSTSWLAAVPFLLQWLLVGGNSWLLGRKEGGGSHLVYGSNLIGSAFGPIVSLLALRAFGWGGTVFCGGRRRRGGTSFSQALYDIPATSWWFPA